MTKNAVQSIKDVSDQVPDFMKNEKAGLGTESLSQDALTPPRLKLAQLVSPELDTIPGLKAGQWFNSLGETNYGDKVLIIPCYLTESYLLFQPRVGDIKGGLLARSNDGIHWDPPNVTFEVTIDKKGTKVKWVTKNTVRESGLAAWGSLDPSDPKSQPAATWSLNTVVMFPEHEEDGPAVLSFMRSGAKVGKKFAGNLKMSRTPSFGRVFELTSEKIGSGGDAYFEPRIRAAGFITRPELYNKGKEIYEMAKERGVQVDASPADVDEPASAPANKRAGDDEVPF